MKRIILTGPESTGKTALSFELGNYFKTPFLPEYAREYIDKLKRPYTYNDVLKIAEWQLEHFTKVRSNENGLLIVDTYLIITKVWFQRVYGHYPGWLDAEIAKTKQDLYLLCKPDIPWVADGVRENGGKMREVLFNDYEHELKSAKLQYKYIEGDGENRINCAINAVNEYIKM